MPIPKKIVAPLAGALGTVALLGVAHTQVAAQEMRTAMKGKQAVTVDIRSEAAAKKLVSYLKGSKANYSLVMGSGKGKLTSASHGSISMADLRKIREKFKTPGQGGDGPIATNAQNGELADAGHVAYVVWGAFDAGRIAATLKGVNARLATVKVYDKINGKQVGTINAGGMMKG